MRKHLERLLGWHRDPPPPVPAPPQAESPPERSRGRYEQLYETLAKSGTLEDVVGGEFDRVGNIELGLLLMEGLSERNTLVDLGCGTGRLAVKLIPRLKSGHYIGIDISPTMLDRAAALISGLTPPPTCRVTWLHQTEPTFSLPEASVDCICAFSVFTHMEHEDSFRYLRAALRIVRPGGLFIFSCLPLKIGVARQVFLAACEQEWEERWASVRNVVTSMELMSEIARLSGWEVLRWYEGDEANIRLPESQQLVPLLQSTCVLRKPDGFVTTR